MTDLARLVPELRDALFEQVPPPEEEHDPEVNGDRAVDDPNDPDQLPELYRLRAYLDGRTYCLVGGDATDFHDIRFVLDFLDSICADLGLVVRYFTLGSDGDNARISAAPVDALERLTSEGLM